MFSDRYWESQVQRVSGRQRSLFSPPVGIQSLIDGGVCDNIKSVLCLSSISIASNTFLFPKPRKYTTRNKESSIIVYWDIFPRYFTTCFYWTSYCEYFMWLLFPHISVTGHLKHCQRCCNFLFRDKSHWLLSASLENPRTKVQDKNIQCNTDSLKFISTVSVRVAGQYSWARGPQ